MTVQERISAFDAWGRALESDSLWSDVIPMAIRQNQWFTPEHILKSKNALVQRMLSKSLLNDWIQAYDLVDVAPKTVALILAGNIPMVGFHDVLCVLITGHKAMIKPSSKDLVLLKFMLNKLVEIEPRFAEQIQWVEQVKDFDAIIATGSNNASVHFNHYFSKYPHIIRKNRRSIAVLDESFSDEDIRALSKDLFEYFGLGCRNVSKLMIHEAVNLEHLMELLHENKEIVLHNKYKNNYDYNYTIMLMNGDDFLMNGACLLKHDPSLHARIATIHYERYSSNEALVQGLKAEQDSVQCYVSNHPLGDLPIVQPGRTQQPALHDYADHVDTIQFLMDLT